MERRFFLPEVIEQAETARMQGHLQETAALTAAALGYPDEIITREKINTLISEKQQLLLLACLGRLFVDSHKSLGNLSKTSEEALPWYTGATTVIQALYSDPSFLESIKPHTHDHLGRPHHFYPEMQRDIARTALAVATVVDAPKQRLLSLRAEEAYKEALSVLSPDDPVHQLVTIELRLLEASTGKTISSQELLDNFRVVTNKIESTNPHRVATVASWLIVYGKQKNNETLIKEAQTVYDNITAEHPDWPDMVGQERQKQVQKRVAIPLPDQEKLIKALLQPK